MINKSYSLIKHIDSYFSFRQEYEFYNLDEARYNELKILIASVLFDIEPEYIKNFLANEYLCNSLKISNKELINYQTKYSNFNNINIFKNITKNSQVAKKELITLIDDYIEFLKDTRKTIELISEGKNEEITNALNHSGYITYSNYLDYKYIDNLRKLIIERAEYERTKKISHIYGNDKLQRVWNLPLKIKNIDEILYEKKIITILENYFNRSTFHQKYYLSSFQANILFNEAQASKWHRDDNVPDPHPAWPIKLNFMIPLDDIDANNGATEFITNSHKGNMKLSSQEIEASTKFQLKLKRGSLASWTGNLWHRSAANYSGKPRVVLLIMFVASYIKEAGCEESYYNSNQAFENMSNKELFKSLIGYEHGQRNGLELV